MFGGAAVAGPSKIAEMAGLDLDPLASGGVARMADELLPGGAWGGGGLKGFAGATKKAAGWWEKRQLARKAALKLFDPEWFRKKRSQEAKYVGCIDLDIAVLHSVSVAGKVAIMRKRNYQRQEQLEENAINLRLQEKLWVEAFGDDDADDD